VLQGANDPRVLKVESDQIVEAVRRRGGVAEYVVFPDEGHGFIKKENNIKAYRAALEFLDKYVRSRRRPPGIRARGPHALEGHSHAAPRTPLESPCPRARRG